jgi:hypothetical protein
MINSYHGRSGGGVVVDLVVVPCVLPLPSPVSAKAGVEKTDRARMINNKLISFLAFFKMFS